MDLIIGGVVGLIVAAVMSPGRSLWLMMLPLYYLLFQAFLHTEFRYTLPMQYFLFTFAAAFWCLLGAGVWKGMTLLTEIIRGRDVK